MDSDMHCLDTVIVGAGLSGLAAACDLKDTSLMLLEKNDYPGGRVYTGNEDGTVYELGALFAYEPYGLPIEINSSPLIREDGPIGLYHQGEMVYGHSGLQCLLETGMTKHELEQLIGADPAAAPAPAIPTPLNALFRVIHPADMADSVPQRRRDALIKFATHHFVQGNRELITALASVLPSPVILKAEVLAVEGCPDHVKTTYRQADQLKTVFSKTAVVSTPAPVAKSIVVSLNQECRNFLASLRYGEGTVVIFGCKDVDFHDFSYIVTPRLPVNTLFKYRTAHEDITVLVVYYVAEQSLALHGKDALEIVSQARDIIGRIHPYTGSMTEDNIIFSRVHRWEHVGPVISADAYGKWTPACRRPSDRVFLCGDYQHVEHVHLMPYGMTAAMLSGRQAAAAVREFLSRLTRARTTGTWTH